MTPQQISLVRQTFSRIAGNSSQAGAFFYDRLFALDPSLRPLFPDDLQEQGQKFVDTLGAVIRALDHAESVADDLDELGQRHVEYGVHREHYDVLREALLWSLAQILEDEYDDEVAAAWCAAYDVAARAMQKEHAVG
jgi:hemoglobin-like flavoprotein